ncbi:hypothetical protein [Streptomyces griseorubiginosus]
MPPTVAASAAAYSAGAAGTPASASGLAPAVRGEQGLPAVPGAHLHPGQRHQGRQDVLDSGQLADGREEDQGELLVGLGDPVGVQGEDRPHPDQPPALRTAPGAAAQREGGLQRGLGGERRAEQARAHPGERGQCRDPGLGAAHLGGLPRVPVGLLQLPAQQAPYGRPVVQPCLRLRVAQGILEALLDQVARALSA